MGLPRFLFLPLLTCCGDEGGDVPLIELPCALGERSQTWSEHCPDGSAALAHVDPMIGTGGSGNAIPGPCLPHGMVKLSPDSEVEAGSVDAYEYDAKRMEGFSHTHLEGPGGGANGYSHVLLMPAVGDIDELAADFTSAIDHDSEEAAAGYYAVTLQDFDVRAELTATAHVGVHRYAFPASEQAYIMLDLGHSRGGAGEEECEVLLSADGVSGCASYNVHPLLAYSLQEAPGSTGEVTWHFDISFSRAPDSQGIFADGKATPDVTYVIGGDDHGFYFGFATEEGETIEARVGLSLIDQGQAAENLALETEGKSFEEVRAEAEDAWSCLLGRVAVEGGTQEQRDLFYTSLYRSAMQPTDYVEPSGSFVSGASGVAQQYEACSGRSFYADDWCVWDTFRTSHPLATLLEPETVDDRVASFLHLYQQGGWLPKCTWCATGYSRVMIGNHAVAVAADALDKGFGDYDQALLWEAVLKAGTEDTEEFLADGICGYLNLGTPPEYIENGYVSHECDPTQSASMTLEYAYNDWATARIAALLGYQDQAEEFEARADNWREHWDPGQGFMRGRLRDGSWVDPFDPTDADDFCEASSWIYSFFVPHDVAGLAEAMGGEEAFVTKLDQFFDEGHFEPDNEPSFHTPFLYNYAGAPERTQQRSRELLAQHFAAEPHGLPGNDDAGATSALYALMAMGLYPVAPGEGVYELGSPIFERVELELHPDAGAGRTFVIEAQGAGEEKLYVQSATLNGQALSEPRISHAQIAAGGVLELVMGAEPSEGVF